MLRNGSKEDWNISINKSIQELTYLEGILDDRHIKANRHLANIVYNRHKMSEGDYNHRYVQAVSNIVKVFHDLERVRRKKQIFMQPEMATYLIDNYFNHIKRFNLVQSNNYDDLIKGYNQVLDEIDNAINNREISYEDGDFLKDEAYVYYANKIRNSQTKSLKLESVA